MGDQPPVDKPKPKRRYHPLANQDFNKRLTANISDGGLDRVAASTKRLEVISERVAHTGGGRIERVILELKGALRAAEQAQNSESNVDGLRSHAAQHAQQAWLLLTGSVPDRIWGRCDCAL